MLVVDVLGVFDVQVTGAIVRRSNAGNISVAGLYSSCKSGSGSLGGRRGLTTPAVEFPSTLGRVLMVVAPV